MAVTLTEAQRAALRGHAIGLRVLVDLYFGSGRYSFWDGAEHYTIDGVQYLAAGAFASVSAISYGQDLGAEGIEIILDGTRLLAGSAEEGDPAAVLASIHSETYHQQRVDVRFAFFSAETGELILTLRRFAGLIDQAEIKEVPAGDEGPGGAFLVLKCESIARRYGRREGRTRSHEDQSEIWAGDEFFKFCSASVAGETRLQWGRQPASSLVSGNVGGGSGGGGDGGGNTGGGRIVHK